MTEEEPRSQDAMDWLIEYPDYLQTEHWSETRKAAIDRAGRECERCGVTGKLQVHHEVYYRLGAEEPGDLLVLCRACHRTRHQEMRAERRYERESEEDL